MGVTGEMAVQLPGAVVTVVVLVEVHVHRGRHESAYLDADDQETCDNLPHHDPILDRQPEGVKFRRIDCSTDRPGL
jgi:hypothetical protein